MNSLARTRRLALLAASLVLWCACASAPPPPAAPAAGLWHDEFFAAPAPAIDASRVFALSDAMKAYLQQPEIARQLRAEGPKRGLINALYRRDQLKIDYDASRTRNAAETFDARAGNCLSLVIMTAAFAKELGLQVTYQSVVVDEMWNRSEGLYFIDGHVNLTLGTHATRTIPGYDADRQLTVDFLPAEEILGQRTHPIAEATVIAMYMNNRAAEALVQGRIDEAYAWTRTALQRDPGFASAVNTLGVIYLRSGHAAEAEQVLAGLLAKEPRNTPAMSNRAMALDRLQRGDEAAALRQRLASIEPEPPYHFFDLGSAALKRGDFTAAKALFAREVERAPYRGEFQYWLGIACLRLGQVEEAQQHLALAAANSTTRDEHDLYTAKLDRLRATQMR